MLPDVLRLEPILVERPWGGRRLERFGRSLPEVALIGESWEIADLAIGGEPSEALCTPVVDGPLRGASLAELIDRYGSELMGSATPTTDGRFPILVKLLDARQHLSVQVHPPDGVARSDPSIRSKNESWYLLDAEPGSNLWFDILADVTHDDFAQALGGRGVVDLLGRLPAEVGAFHHIPAGRVHALGAGVLVLEVQTPSDTTFRIYDWSEEYERPDRELHGPVALESIVRGDPAAVSLAATSTPGERALVSTPEYWMKEHRTRTGRFSLDPDAELRVVTVARGQVILGGETVETGASRILPASSKLLGPLACSPDAVVIETGIV
ncbi:MAG: type I phosphomannose isomerase catalytic subunit [Acidimicrobiia bacterium]